MKHFASFALCALIGASIPAAAQVQGPPAPSALAPVAPEFRVIPEASLPQPIFVPGGFCALSQTTNGTQSCNRKVYFVQSTDPAFGGSEKAILAAATSMTPDNPHYTATITAVDN